MFISKGKRPTSTNGVEAYSKEQLAEEIRRLTTTNAQLVNDKLGIEVTNAKLEADKNRLINKKNIFIAKRKKLRTELAATRTIPIITPAITNSDRDIYYICKDFISSSKLFPSVSYLIPI